MKIVRVVAPNVRAGVAEARRQLGLDRTPVRTRSGEDSEHRVTFVTGDVAEIHIVPRKPAEIIEVREID